MSGEYIYHPLKEMTRLTPSRRVGYAESDKENMSNPTNERTRGHERRNPRAAIDGGSNIDYEVLKQLLELGGINELGDLVPADFEKSVLDLRFKSVGSGEPIQQSELDNLLQVVEPRINAETRAGRVKNADKLSRAKRALQNIKSRLGQVQQGETTPTTREVDTAQVEETPLTPTTTDIDRAMKDRADVEEMQSEAQVKAQEKIQSFETAQDMFFALSTGVDKSKWGAENIAPEGELRNPDIAKKGTIPFPLVRIKAWERGPDGRIRPKRPQEESIEIIEENVLRFVRERINFYAGESPRDPVNFIDRLSFLVGGRTINLYQEMVIKQGKLFREELGEGSRKGYLFRLGNNIAKEMLVAMWTRDKGVTFWTKFGKGGPEYANLLTQLFADNRFTDLFYGDESSMLEFMATLPQNYSSDMIPDKDTGALRRRSDNKVGYSFLLMVETIMNLANRGALEELYPEGCELLDFKTVEAEVREQAKNLHRDPDETIKALEQNDEQWKKAKNDPVNHVLDVVNLFNLPQKDELIIKAVRNIIRRMVAKRYDVYLDPEMQKVDNDNLEFAYLLAENFAQATGIITMLDIEARNFSGAAVHRSLRSRLRDVRGRMRWSGPATTLNALTETAVPFFWAGATTNGKSIAETFFELRDKADKATEKVRDIEKKQALNEEEKKKEELLIQQAFMKNAETLSFKRNEMIQYTRDHISNAVAIHDLMSSGKEIHWEEYTKFDDRDKQFVLKEEDFGEKVLNDILKKIYNMYSTWGSTNFAQDYQMIQEGEFAVRDADGNIVMEHGEPKMEKRSYFVTVPLAEAMFGKEVLDIPAFWKTEKRIHPITRKLRDMPIKDIFGQHVIDAQKVNTNKVDLVKSIFLNIVAGQIFAHRVRYGHDIRYGSSFYRSVITVLRSVPDSEFRDPDNLQNNRFMGHAFSRYEIGWLRRKARITEPHLFLLDLVREMRKPGKVGEVSKEVLSPLVGAAKKDMGL